MLSIIPGAADFTAADLQKGRKIRAFFYQFSQHRKGLIMKGKRGFGIE
jgi:hypothetical protein